LIFNHFDYNSDIHRIGVKLTKDICDIDSET